MAQFVNIPSHLQGSADVIVNKNAYTPGSTAKDTGKTFSTAYGDGTTASGSVSIWVERFMLSSL